MLKAKLHDGKSIEVVVEGDGPAILLPVNPHGYDLEKAAELEKWGVDPNLGRKIIDGLKDNFKVVAFDYERHVFAEPKPDTLTPENIAKDFLAVADAADVEKFAFYGYSWLAVSGLQLAIRTDRLTALIIGGWPPLDAPYKEMLITTKVTYDMALKNEKSPKKESEQNWDVPEDFDWSQAEVTMTPAQTKQFYTFYQHLQDLNDRAIQDKIKCPKLCFVGDKDEIDYDEKWGDVLINIAKPIIDNKSELESLGWEVHIFPNMDHLKAMQATTVLPVISPWLKRNLKPIL